MGHKKVLEWSSVELFLYMFLMYFILEKNTSQEKVLTNKASYSSCVLYINQLHHNILEVCLEMYAIRQVNEFKLKLSCGRLRI